MTKDEALKLALEALETNNKAWKHLADSGDAGFWEAEEQPFYELSVKAITAIKEALEQPEQEPVAFICEFYADEGHPFVSFEPVTHGTNTPLYTTPPQRKPLTDEEIDKAWRSCDYTVPWEQHRIDIARAIEAAHGIKG